MFANVFFLWLPSFKALLRHEENTFTKEGVTYEADHLLEICHWHVIIIVVIKHPEVGHELKNFMVFHLKRNIEPLFDLLSSLLLHKDFTLAFTALYHSKFYLIR
jgi:hypothetical protein